jgi:hypothetical protein
MLVVEHRIERPHYVVLVAYPAVVAKGSVPDLLFSRKEHNRLKAPLYLPRKGGPISVEAARASFVVAAARRQIKVFVAVAFAMKPFQLNRSIKCSSKAANLVALNLGEGCKVNLPFRVCFFSL